MIYFKKIIVLIFLFTNCSLVLAKESNKKSMIFIIANSNRITDFKKIYDPKKRSMIFIGKPYCLDLLSEKQRKYFDEIIITYEELTEQHLATIVQRILNHKKITKMGQIFFSTTDEELVEILDKVRLRLNITEQNNIRFRDKLIMKSYMEKSNVKIPKYLHFNSQRYKANKESYIEEIYHYLGDKIIAKPTNGLGSHNVSKIFSKNELKAWAMSHQDEEKYELDEFIEGELYHSDLFVKNGEILNVFTFKWATPIANWYHHAATPGVIMLDQYGNDHNIIKNMAINALNAFGIISDGIYHMEIFQKPNQELVFLEVGYRPPAEPMFYLYQECLNIDIQYIHTALQLKIPIDMQPKINYYCGFVGLPQGTINKLINQKLKWIRRPIRESYLPFEYVVLGKSYRLLEEFLLNVQKDKSWYNWNKDDRRNLVDILPFFPHFE